MGFYYGAITRKRKKASNPNDQLIITNYKENGKGHEIKEGVGVGSSFVFWILVVFSSFLSQFKEGCYFLKREKEEIKNRVVGGKLNKITTTTKKKKSEKSKKKLYFLSFQIN